MSSFHAPRQRQKQRFPRGRGDRPGDGKGRAGGGKGRSGAARGPDKKFAKRGFADKSDGGERRSYAAKPDRAKSHEKKPYSGSGQREDGRPPRRISAIVRHASIATTAGIARATLEIADRAGSFGRARIATAESALMRRAAIVRTTTATIALRAAATATLVRPRVLPTRNSVTSDRTRRAARFSQGW